MPHTILITGASSGFGYLISKALATAGHRVFASIREHNTRNAVTEVVNTPRGKRPFRVHVDPVRDGAEEAFGVIDRVREEMLRRMDLHDLCYVTTTHCNERDNP